jgi:hypothetical protein
MKEQSLFESILNNIKKRGTIVPRFTKNILSD